jgi:hypothetical protein
MSHQIFFALSMRFVVISNFLALGKTFESIWNSSVRKAFEDHLPICFPAGIVT